MFIKYLGHSCIEIDTNGTCILIDPFLACCPDYKPQNITDIFVTHGHSDHLGSAVEIAKSNNSTITAIYELANYCLQKGANTNGIGLGSRITYPWGKVIAVQAFHSSSLPNGAYAGCPCGFIFQTDNKIVYHAGDTCLFADMKTIGELYKPDVAILPVGGHFTMDIEHAVTASKWLNAKTVIPIHYNTFSAIRVDISEFKTKINEIGKEAKVLAIGQKIEV